MVGCGRKMGGSVGATGGAGRGCGRGKGGGDIIAGGAGTGRGAGGGGRGGANCCCTGAVGRGGTEADSPCDGWDKVDWVSGIDDGRRLPWRAVYFALKVSMTIFPMAFNVVKTPIPWWAWASKVGTLNQLICWSISTIVATPGKSRLLYCRTNGTEPRSMPYSFRFSCRFFRLSMFSCILSRWLSATNTTPSTPRSTSLRVAL